MKLLTEEMKRKLPALRATETTPLLNKIFVFKFFTPWSCWTWYVVEGEEQDNGDWLFWGYVEGIESEWGYFSLKELEDITTGPGGLKVERDLHFEDVPARKLLEEKA